MELQDDYSLLLYGITYGFGPFQSDEYNKAYALFGGLEKGLTSVYGEPDPVQSSSTSLFWFLSDTTISLERWETVSGLYAVKIHYQEKRPDESINNSGF